MPEYCPFTSTCPFYQNWVELTDWKGVEVITVKDGEIITIYDCLALIYLNATHGKIKIGDSLKKKLSDPNAKEFRCSHITLLNKLTQLCR